MENLISKISELNINGYYDASNGYVTVWFHNNNSEKSDIVAYLQSDMSWDVREIISEKSEVKSDKEIVTIQHNLLSVEVHESTFDIIVRKMLYALIENEQKELPYAVAKMKDILDSNSYGLLVLN